MYKHEPVQDQSSSLPKRSAAAAVQREASLIWQGAAVELQLADHAIVAALASVRQRMVMCKCAVQGRRLARRPWW